MWSEGKFAFQKFPSLCAEEKQMARFLKIRRDFLMKGITLCSLAAPFQQNGIRKMNGTDSSCVFHKTFLAALVAIFFGTCALFSCASIEKKLSDLAAPCAIFDSQIVERGAPGIEFMFSNLGERKIACVKFFARVQEGGDSDDGFSDESMEKEFSVNAEFNSGDSEQIFIPFAEFEFEAGIENYFVDALFVSEIIFSDGEIWSDRNGRAAL